MLGVHISKHSLFRLKITVGFCVCVHVTCGVWVVCVHVVLCVVLVVVVCVVCVVWCVWCGVVWCGVVWCVVCGACVWCVVKLGTLSLFLSLLPLLFPFRFPFLFLSYLYFSLFFFFFFFYCSFSYSCSCSCSFSFSSLSLPFSPPNTMERTDQPTRRPTSRHSNVIWRRASAQQSVLSLLLPLPFQRTKKKKRKLFIYYRNISGYYSFKLIPKKSPPGKITVITVSN